MTLFGNKKKNTINTTQKGKKEEIKINEKPRICCFDIKEDVIDRLKGNGYNIYSATLGSKIKVPNKYKESTQLLLNHQFPENLHEYDVFILDLDNFETVEYKDSEHIRDSHTGDKALYLLSEYPETLFDPRPLASFLLNKKLDEIGNKPFLVVAFTSQNYKINYQLIEKYDGGHIKYLDKEEYGIYSFSNIPTLSPRAGKLINVSYNHNDDLTKFLNKYIKELIYNQTFQHPSIYKNDEYVEDPNYIPLIINDNENIVSICKTGNKSCAFYFPQIENKFDFLDDFLSQIATRMMPELFPYASEFKWKNNSEYWLPNHLKLLDKKNNLQKEYEKKLKDKEEEIISNTKKYNFLHDIIIETGDKLVNALIKYFEWLGFDDIINFDENENDDNNKILEEDIQINLITPKGLLVIECKGIGGTSTDSDCSQISKIRYRRCEERNAFDVSALYVVNHQRYLPPLNRKNPPFTENQIKDAINDKRGLLSTWQLYNLYFDVVNGIIKKEEARKDLLEYGLVDFRPKNLTFIDEPKEIFKNGYVSIINLNNIELAKDDNIFIEKNGKFSKTHIVSLEENDKNVKKVSTGVIGLKLNNPIKQKSKLWKIEK